MNRDNFNCHFNLRNTFVSYAIEICVKEIMNRHKLLKLEGIQSLLPGVSPDLRF